MRNKKNGSGFTTPTTEWKGNWRGKGVFTRDATVILEAAYDEGRERTAKGIKILEGGNAPNGRTSSTGVRTEDCGRKRGATRNGTWLLRRGAIQGLSGKAGKERERRSKNEQRRNRREGKRTQRK